MFFEEEIMGKITSPYRKELCDGIEGCLASLNLQFKITNHAYLAVF